MRHGSISPARARAAAKTDVELASGAGISLRTLRFCEERGFVRGRYHASGRRYDEADELRLRVVVLGRRMGFSLRQIEWLLAPRFECRPVAPMVLAFRPPDAVPVDRSTARTLRVEDFG